MIVTSLRLSGFAVRGMLLAETAILHQFDAVGGVFLILFLIVVALLAFGAGQYNVLPRFLGCHCGNTSFLGISGKDAFPS
jgi:uncharacterized membrane protein AbrB (regulator of aidB expression)